jgi:hypothetical protein
MYKALSKRSITLPVADLETALSGSISHVLNVLIKYSIPTSHLRAMFDNNKMANHVVVRAQLERKDIRALSKIVDVMIIGILRV